MENNIIFEVFTIVSEVLISGTGITGIVLGIIQVSKKNNHQPIKWIFSKIGEFMQERIKKDFEEQLAINQKEVKDLIESFRYECDQKLEEIKKENKEEVQETRINFIRFVILKTVGEMKKGIKIDEELENEIYELFGYYNDWHAKHQEVKNGKMDKAEHWFMAHYNNECKGCKICENG